MRNIRKVQKGKAPTLLNTEKANDVITAINALMNMQIERGDYDKFEVSHNNSLLTLQTQPEGQGSADFGDFEELDNVYLCINGEAKQRTILIKKED